MKVDRVKVDRVKVGGGDGTLMEVMRYLDAVIKMTKR